MVFNQNVPWLFVYANYIVKLTMIMIGRLKRIAANWILHFVNIIIWNRWAFMYHSVTVYLVSHLKSFTLLILRVVLSRFIKRVYLNTCVYRILYIFSFCLAAKSSTLLCFVIKSLCLNDILLQKCNHLKHSFVETLEYLSWHV